MLRRKKFLFLDCQTTGMRPPTGHLLELAWTFASAEDDAPEISSFLVQLPEGQEIPPRVREMTGIESLEGAVPLAQVFAKFHAQVSAAGEDLTSVIHYAQFEKPYLIDLFTRFSASGEIPFPILCSHQLTKRIFPNLPSQNLRGAAGFFGVAPGTLKRASSHVAATHQIWRGLIAEIEKLGLETVEAVQNWQPNAPKTKATRYEYRLDKLKRLELPDSPGIYRMLANSGEVLYVGKATSLKSRVNSYFRGKKGRDLRKLEMLAQVWDLRVTGCATALEAALMETDEIKRYNPPYNVVLKRGRRHLVFYNRDFSASSNTQSTEFTQGPFRNMNWIEHLRLLHRSLNQSEFEQIFFNPIPPADARLGFEMFLSLNGYELSQIKSVRSLLAIGFSLLKLKREEEELNLESEGDSGTDDLEEPLSIEEIAAKFERLLRRSAAEYQRGKLLTSLLNAKVIYQSKAGTRELVFQNGVIDSNTRSSTPTSISQSRPRLPWISLDIDAFDRMSILLSELNKYEHTIET